MSDDDDDDVPELEELTYCFLNSPEQSWLHSECLVAKWRPELCSYCTEFVRYWCLSSTER
jgi:hypothetical protein